MGRKDFTGPWREDKKSNTVRELFDSLAERYDLFNLVASLFQERYWRKTLNRFVRPDTTILDLCSGTGQQVFSMDRAVAGKGTGKCKIVGIDFSRGMIKIADQRLRKCPRTSKIEFRLARAEHIPFKPNTFDTITSEFAMRSLFPSLNEVLQEIYRVLKPGGQVLILELTRPPHFILFAIYRLYLTLILPLVSLAIFGRARSVNFLRQSILHFHSAEDFKKRLQWAGLRKINVFRLSGGIATLFMATKVSCREIR